MAFGKTETKTETGPVVLEVEPGYEEKSGVSKKSGNEYHMFLQKAWLHGVDRFPLSVDLAHFERSDVLPGGKYAVTVEHEVFNGRHVVRPKYVPMNG